ncbi:hypothetical protein GCM10027055_04460 [Janibacter alkaliphilus]
MIAPLMWCTLMSTHRGAGGPLSPPGQADVPCDLGLARTRADSHQPPQLPGQITPAPATARAIHTIHRNCPGKFAPAPQLPGQLRKGGRAAQRAATAAS